MKKFLCALSALVLSAGVCSADYSQKVTSNVALLHGVPGPMDFSQLFTSQADFDYYCSTGKLTTGVSPTWMAIRPLPYDGQIVALAINGQEPKAYILKSKANGMFDAVKMATDTSVQTALAGLTNKRDIRDEYHYALEWDFTEFNAIKDNVGYKVAKDEDNEYIWKVYKVVPGEEDVAIANCSKVDPDEEEPTKLKIIVADLTDGDYAGLADKIISAYPSKTTDKFALKSDITKLSDDSAAKADAAIYGSKSEVITVDGHDVVVSIENAYAAKYIPLGFDGINFNVKFYLTVDGSKIEIPFDSCNDSEIADENDEYNTATMISFGGDEFPEELTFLDITSVKIEYVSGSSDYSSSRFKYTINGTKESSTSFDVKNPSQAVDSRKFDGKSASDWVNTFLPMYFYNKTDANTEFHNKYYVDSNVVTGKIDGVFFEARISNGSNARVVLRGATLPITDILSWTNKTDCIELYVSNNFSVAYSNPEVYQISTTGASLGFNIRFPDFPNVGIHLEGNAAYIGNAVAPEYKFIGGVGKPYTPWHNPGLATDSHKFAGLTYAEAFGNFVNATNELTIGSGATNVNHKESVTLNGCRRYPSYTWGFANVNIGLDNVTGFGDDGVGGVKNSEGVLVNGRAFYDVVIGTSSSAKYQHSYVFGSQAHALAENSFIFGYGASTLDNNSTIIGFGARPQPDKKFNTFNDMWDYFKSFANYTAATNAIFADMMICVTNDISHLPIFPHPSPVELNGSYYVKSVLTAKDASGSWVELYQNTPHPDRDEYIRGRHNASYGKTHGNGTVNLVTSVGDELNKVYINDKSLKKLVKEDSATTVLPASKSNIGVTFFSSGNDQNAAVEIGKYAAAKVEDDYVNSLTSAKTLRSVGVAIGAYASVTNPANKGTTQGVAIGFHAKAEGSQAIAIGAGSKHNDGTETDLTGDNTYSKGDLSMAIGYGVKALGKNTTAIGSSGGGSRTTASGEGATAIGYDAVASGAKSFALGANVTASGDRSFALGAGASNAGTDGIAIGNNAVIGSAGANSVQLGAGSVNLPNSLKFGDIFIVKNGELVAAPAASDAVEEDLSDATVEDDVTVLKLKSGSSVTILPKVSATEIEEFGFRPFSSDGKRNYTVTMPNEPNMCDGLPIQVISELPEGMKLVLRNGSPYITRLPAQIKSEQPYGKLCIWTIDVMDDGTDWTPVVTRNNIGYSNGKFTSYGSTALRGYNLHAATEFKIAYPTATGVKTNDVLNLSAGQEFSLSHLYRSANMGVGTLDASADIQAIDGSGNCWFDVIYKTVNGTATIARKTFNTLTGITPESEGLRRIGSLEWITEGGDNSANGYFVITTNATSSILVDPANVAIKYVLQNNTTNTVAMSSMTVVTDPLDPAGFKTSAITGLKFDATNKIEYVSINSDVTNYLFKVVSEVTP